MRPHQKNMFSRQMKTNNIFANELKGIKENTYTLLLTKKVKQKQKKFNVHGIQGWFNIKNSINKCIF